MKTLFQATPSNDVRCLALPSFGGTGGKHPPLLWRGPGGGLFFLLIILLLNTSPVSAQQKDWQWIKRGGASIAGNERAHVYDIATDSDRNVYVVSPIGVYDLNIDGHPKTYYGGSGGTSSDYALASFSCDGNYRWSKIIGGKATERPFYIETDGNDNLYLAGRFSSCEGNNPGEAPARIENDIVLDQTPNSCSLMVLAKYNKNGNLLWYRQPQQPTTIATALTYTQPSNISVDSSGNIYWLVGIPPETYANGGFVNTMQGINWFVFKYDTTGNFLNATHLDIQLNGGSIVYYSIKMYRNPNNGYFYVTGRRASTETATIGGQTVTGSFYMACFDGQGNFQWMRQNTGTGTRTFSLDFDSQNNIYMGGLFAGGNSDVFIGQSVPEQMTPNFVMKTNPNATTAFWFSYDNRGGAWNQGGVDLENGILAFTNQTGGQDFTWGNQTIDVTMSGQGTEVLLAFFDKNTGACINLDFIQGNPGNGYADRGTALGVDANGDVLIGGEFYHTLYYANGGSVLNPNPGNPDFFIAKYATSPCPTMNVKEEGKTGVGLWPNPVRDKLHVSVGRETAYKLYGLDGRLVKKGKLSKEENTIHMKSLSTGIYLLKLEEDGMLESLKVVKE